LHRLLKPAEPLVITFLTQAAVECELETLKLFDLMLVARFLGDADGGRTLPLSAKLS
jgi:hypothetical protein